MPIEKLPHFMRSQTINLKKWLLSDAFPLFVLGSEMVVTGIDYLTKQFRTFSHPTSHPIEQFLTPLVAGVFWIVIGIACFVGVAYPRSKFSGVVVGFGVATNIVWGGSSLVANLFFTDGAYGFGSFIRYTSIAALIAYIVWLKEVMRQNQMPSREEVARALYRTNI